ncbi:hypothetical protein CHU95_05140 [Niveispirillum lacus]|uniref:Spermidine synthase n=1 Tax=Niveispirillum lacus TaxID=1981099 RepID=A0A255Z3X5_9PROT|nr:hypothetical protein [Niveispirillum lacus]OYQ36178.1 hypothetical protein CHU95_05140 [Niveispirillum lacus]
MTMQESGLPPGLEFYETDLFIPTYRLGDGDNGWRLRAAALSISPGYWTPTRLVRDMVALLRHGDTWMSTSPMELESQEIGVRLAHGHVLICGMGMGWAAVNCALRPDVTRVTVVELDPAILALHRELDLTAQVPPSARAKLHLVQGDAYSFVPDQPVDLLMPDIWLPLMNDGRVEEVRHMQANIQAGAVYFWGQELEIARHGVAWGYDLDDAGIAATIRRLDLPLIGPAIDDYAGKLRGAVRQHMRGRWLPGSVSPPLV